MMLPVPRFAIPACSVELFRCKGRHPIAQSATHEIAIRHLLARVICREWANRLGQMQCTTSSTSTPRRRHRPDLIQSTLRKLNQPEIQENFHPWPANRTVSGRLLAQAGNLLYSWPASLPTRQAAAAAITPSWALSGRYAFPAGAYQCAALRIRIWGSVGGVRVI